MKGLKKLILATVPLILTTLSGCCTTSQTEKDPEVVLYFPSFPDVIDEEKTIVTFYPEAEIKHWNDIGEFTMTFKDIVVMPLFFWKKIVRYVLEVEETEKIYESYRKNIEN